MKKILGFLGVAVASIPLLGRAQSDLSSQELQQKYPIQWDMTGFNDLQKQQIYDLLIKTFPTELEIYEEEKGVWDLYCDRCDSTELYYLESISRPFNEQEY